MAPADTSQDQNGSSFDVNELLELLPPDKDAGRTLTREDLLLIAQLIDIKLRVTHIKCARDLTEEDALVVKKFVGLLNKGASALGYTIIGSVVTVILAMFAKGFWAYLANGVKSVKGG